MKNHKMVEGRLLETNKKWSQLSEKQRTWIYEITKQAHGDYVEEHGHLPMKKRKEDVLDKVHDKVLERDIWIPYGEFRPHVMKTIDRLNRKHSLLEPSAFNKRKV